jgi:hypothetical protein
MGLDGKKDVRLDVSTIGSVSGLKCLKDHRGVGRARRLRRRGSLPRV